MYDVKRKNHVRIQHLYSDGIYRFLIITKNTNELTLLI